MRTGTLAKSIGVFLVVAVGGPALTMYITPTEEELFKKYNPELQKRSLEGREERLREANEFAEKLKKYSKSDKPIWTVWQEDADRQKNQQLANEKAIKQERKSIAEEMRKQRMDGNST